MVDTSRCLISWDLFWSNVAYGESKQRALSSNSMLSLKKMALKWSEYAVIITLRAEGNIRFCQVISMINLNSKTSYAPASLNVKGKVRLRCCYPLFSLTLRSAKQWYEINKEFCHMCFESCFCCVKKIVPSTRWDRIEFIVIFYL